MNPDENTGSAAAERTASPTQGGGGGGPRRFVMIGAAVLVAIGLVLYGILPRSGKEEQASASCAATRALAQKLTPLVHGEVAALSLAANPKPLPALTFDGPDGKKRSLEDFRGRAILFNLWATWCVPCRQEMPALDRLEAALGSPDFEVVAVNIDTARLDRPKAFLNEIGVKKLGFYTDNKADVFQVLKREGKVLGLPTTILVGKDGCEIGTMARPAQWDSPDAQALIKAIKGA
jgi:thiol-disulfide isomerase/thioredoxin